MIVQCDPAQNGAGTGCGIGGHCPLTTAEKRNEEKERESQGSKGSQGQRLLCVSELSVLCCGGCCLELREAGSVSSPVTSPGSSKGAVVKRLSTVLSKHRAAILAHEPYRQSGQVTRASAMRPQEQCLRSHGVRDAP